MIRVAQIIDSLKMGGAEQLLALLVRELKKQHVDVTVISLRSDADPALLAKLRDECVRVCAMPARSLLAPFRLARLSSFLRSNGFDIVQTHLSSSNIVGGLAAQLAGIKVVSTLHSIDTDPRYFHPVRDKLETGILRHVSGRVVAVGNAVADAHRARIQRSINVIPNAVAPFPGVSYLERCLIRQALPGDADWPLLISVGRLSPPKGFEVLIDAFAIVRQSGKEARLLIAGAGILEAELKNQIGTLNLEDSVFLLGRREDIPHLLAASDAYVSASHWEGLPISILEAMSAGLPVIATAVGDIPAVVNNQCGYLVPPKDPAALARAIIRILDDSQTAYCMGRVARQYVEENHSPARWVEQIMNLYLDVLDIPKLRKAI